jgi:glycyl-tRNA synthetase
VAQIGKAFRNEITPGNFIFRTREFDQMEIEYFVKPDDGSAAFETWLGEMKTWCEGILKISPDHLTYHEIPESERAFYSARTIDVEYAYPFGVKELYGLANRTDYDLSRHQEASKEDLRFLDPETNERYIPHVIEPTWGLDRTVLVTLLEHLDIDEAESATGDAEPRMVLRFPAVLAPIKVAVLPLQKKGGLPEIARELASTLRSHGITTEYDESASIGKRYRRQDEIGTPWCITVDMESASDHAATIRDRDSMAQERVAIEEIPGWIEERLSKM